MGKCSFVSHVDHGSRTGRRSGKCPRFLAFTLQCRVFLRSATCGRVHKSWRYCHAIHSAGQRQLFPAGRWHGLASTQNLATSIAEQKDISVPRPERHLVSQRSRNLELAGAARSSPRCGYPLVAAEIPYSAAKPYSADIRTEYHLGRASSGKSRTRCKDPGRLRHRGPQSRPAQYCSMPYPLCGELYSCTCCQCYRTGRRSVVHIRRTAAVLQRFWP